jgi:hypothetical protein
VVHVHPFLYLSINCFSYQEPVLPAVLKKAREDAKRYGQTEEYAKSDDVCTGVHSDGATEVMSTDAVTGRPIIKFIDVGTKFTDPKDQMRRMKESQRRAKLRSKKVSKRQFAVA